MKGGNQGQILSIEKFGGAQDRRKRLGRKKGKASAKKSGETGGTLEI